MNQNTIETGDANIEVSDQSKKKRTKLCSLKLPEVWSNSLQELDVKKLLKFNKVKFLSRYIIVQIWRNV